LLWFFKGNVSPATDIRSSDDGQLSISLEGNVYDDLARIIALDTEQGAVEVLSEKGGIQAA